MVICSAADTVEWSHVETLDAVVALEPSLKSLGKHDGTCKLILKFRAFLFQSVIRAVASN